MSVRGSFGSSSYRQPYYRGELASAFYRTEIRQPDPNKCLFLDTSDRRKIGVADNARNAENSSFLFTPYPGDNDTSLQRHFFPPELPYRSPYHVAFSTVRGNAGPVALPTPAPPPIPFLATDIPWRSRHTEGNSVLPPIFMEYDPLGMGAWLNTPVPSRSLVLLYHQDNSLIVSPPMFLPTVPAEILVHIKQSLSYKRPWVQDSSQIRSQQGADFVFQHEVQRYINPVLPRQYGAYYKDLAAGLSLFGVTNLTPQPAGGTLYDIYHYYANHN